MLVPRKKMLRWTMQIRTAFGSPMIFEKNCLVEENRSTNVPNRLRTAIDGRAASYSEKTRVIPRGIPFALIGIMLLLTAGAKAWLLISDSFADIRVGLSTEILWLAVAFEVFLAFANFFWRDRHSLACVDTVVFACFAVFAATRLMLGYSNCGCSGGLEIPGWVFLLIDVLIVGWFMCRSQSRSSVSAGVSSLRVAWKRMSMSQRGRLAGIGLLAIFLVLLQLPFAAQLRANVFGDPILARVEVDEVLRVGIPTQGTIELANRSSESVTLVGVSRSCKCLELINYPYNPVVGASGTLALKIEIKPEKSGPLRQRVVLFVDHPEQFRVTCDLFCQVEE